MRMAHRFAIGATCFLISTVPSSLAYCDIGWDGRLFDPGVAMAVRAQGAPSELDLMAFTIGQWEVELTTTAADGTTRTSKALSHVTWMNRGHGIMERTYSEDFDGSGQPAWSISFLAFNHGAKVWNFGEADTVSHASRIFDGVFEAERLVLHDARRPGGGPGLVLLRRSWEKEDHGYRVLTEISIDLGKTYRSATVRRYRRREPTQDFLAPTDDFGRPSPKRPSEAAAFDFLIGAYDARHWILFSGQEVRFPSTTTAVYALGGHAILEFDWYDVDPNLPDAATTVLRIYNPAQRRWESLYVNNRFSSMLWFGGQREGERIVLGNFDTDLTRPVSRFVFYDIGKEGGYRWFAESSQDRQQTFTKTWTIDVTPRAAEDNE